MTRLDLIPPGFHARRATRRALRRWSRRLVLALGAAVLLNVSAARLVADRRAELDGLRERYASLRQELEKAEALLDDRERLDRHERAVGAVRDAASVTAYLGDLGTALPDASYLTELSLSLGPVDPRDAADDPAGVILRGRAPDQQQVGRILRGLASGGFADATLLSLARRTDGPRRSAYEFEIVGRLDGPEGRP